MSNSEIKITETAPKGKKKARSPSILLSQNFYTIGRNRKWIKDHGSDAVIILQTVWCQCKIESSHRVRKDEAPALPYPLPFDDAKIIEILDSAVEVGLLEADADHYFNSQIIQDEQEFAIKKQNYAEAWEKRQTKQNGFIKNPSRIHDEESKDHIVSVSVPVVVDEFISLKSPEKLSLLGLETVEALERWQKYQKKRGKHFDLMQAEAKLLEYTGRYPTLVAAINKSIGNGWKNAVETSESPTDPPKNGQKHESKHDRNLRLMGIKTSGLIGN